MEGHLHGVYHLTNAGSCSWYEFVREIFELVGLKFEVTPVPGFEYPLPTARPANGVLSSLGCATGARPLEGYLGELEN